MEKIGIYKKIIISILSVSFMLTMVVSSKAANTEDPHDMQKIDVLWGAIKALRDMGFWSKTEDYKDIRCEKIKKFLTEIVHCGCSLPNDSAANVDRWCKESREIVKAELDKISCLGMSPEGYNEIRKAMTYFQTNVLFAVAEPVGVVSSSKSYSMEMNTDRPGMEYKNFDLRAAEPTLCGDACMKDATCKAWTYVKPGFQGNNARCWLKNNVPLPKTNRCCVSGVK